MQKANLQPTAGNQPDLVALGETVIQLTGQRYWLYAAVDPDTNKSHCVRHYPTGTTALTEMFLHELKEKHDIENAVFLVDSAPWLKAALHQLFINADPATAETWLQSYAYCWNQLI